MSQPSRSAVDAATEITVALIRGGHISKRDSDKYAAQAYARIYACARRLKGTTDAGLEAAAKGFEVGNG